TGSESVTVTPVAGSGPLLVSVMVKVITSPTLGLVLSTVLDSTRSACCGLTGALAWLLVGLGANWSVALTDDVLVWASGLSTRAVIVRVWACVGSTVPTVQTPPA